jgi:hypothetical protein
MSIEQFVSVLESEGGRSERKTTKKADNVRVEDAI